MGRIAGQYAKPRSVEFVEVNGAKIHNYKGDNINSVNETDRNPCPDKLMRGYHYSFAAAQQIEATCPDLFISHEGLVLPYE
jgi:3-deoxy-7-phosphoheptulonate synthase